MHAEHARKRRLSVHHAGAAAVPGFGYPDGMSAPRVRKISETMPRWGPPQFLADLHERMRDPQMPREMVEAMRTLSQRRLERLCWTCERSS
jgi:hypothetical protein